MAATAAVALATAGVSGCGSGGSDEGSPQTRSAVITNGGSLMEKPYTLTVTVNPDGQVTPTNLPAELAERLFRDLEAARLENLPDVPCAKPASFAQEVFIEYRGVKSPDIGCAASDPRGAALADDVRQIQEALGLPERANGS